MAGQRCPNCQENNPSGNEYCQYCGVSITPRTLVISQSKPVILQKPQLPARQLKRLGASVAIGVVALLTEVSVLYLRRRLQGLDGPLLPVSRRRQLPVKTKTVVEEKKNPGKRVVTVYSERIIEERRWGRPMRRIVDRLAWRSEENLDS